jgi:hypothetical protein
MKIVTLFPGEILHDFKTHVTLMCVLAPGGQARGGEDSLTLIVLFMVKNNEVRGKVSQPHMKHLFMLIPMNCYLF